MANICISDLKLCDSIDIDEVLSEQDQLSINGGAVTSALYSGGGGVGIGIGVSVGGYSFGVGLGFAGGGGQARFAVALV
jgi:hypothetical protein